MTHHSESKVPFDGVGSEQVHEEDPQAEGDQQQRVARLHIEGAGQRGVGKNPLMQICSLLR